MKIAVLSGGVGGAKMARGFEHLTQAEATVVVNVGDDDSIYGLDVSPDLDTVVYTMADVQGAPGWGRDGDSTTVMEELARFGVDTSFTIGDRDLALNLHRTALRAAGVPLSTVTARIAAGFGLRSTVVPATDDPVRTEVRRADDGRWLDFQTYFVRRRHADRIDDVRFTGADAARPAPGVIEAIDGSDLVVIGPSNPVLSVWPILAVPGIEKALADHRRVVAVSPLIGGRAVKGPAAEVMDALGLGATSAGLITSYRGVVDGLVIDEADRHTGHPPGVDVLVTDTMIPDPSSSRRLAEEIVQWV